MLLDFSDDAFDLLNVASNEDDSKALMAQHHAYQDLWRALQKITDDPKGKEAATKLREAGEQLGIVFEEGWNEKDDPAAEGNKLKPRKKKQVKTRTDVKKMLRGMLGVTSGGESDDSSDDSGEDSSDKDST
ncbi:hypothetical protein FRC06_006144 [Ceratobasidium sp. 370]|nr:hypothetical protein FRC06_006144 [Ceratobasidium sp. 370]